MGVIAAFVLCAIASVRGPLAGGVWLGGLEPRIRGLDSTDGTALTYLDSWLLPLATNCLLNEPMISSDVTGSNPSEAHIAAAFESKPEGGSLIRGARFWNNCPKVDPSMFTFEVRSWDAVARASWPFCATRASDHYW